MARIIYGVSGEGSGHSSRAREVIDHLETGGHDVWVVSYDRGAKDLGSRFKVFEVEGLHIATEDNAVSVVKTFTDNIGRIGKGSRRFKQLKKELFEDFNPDCVITDFEPMTAYLANHFDLPLISIDNQHRMRYMEYPRPADLRTDAIVTETVIRAMVPRPDVALVTTFYFGPVKNDRTFLFSPILRREILEQATSDGDHILVYLTSGFSSFVDRLGEFDREVFRIYGSANEGDRGNLSFRPFSRDGFLEDLASCRAVMATAGFTLITESLHLGKPYLALPMKGQFEQELNGLLLAELGCGVCCRNVGDETIGDFLYRIPDMKQRLAGYESADNSAIMLKIDELLADSCRLALAIRNMRKPGSF